MSNDQSIEVGQVYEDDDGVSYEVIKQGPRPGTLWKVLLGEDNPIPYFKTTNEILADELIAELPSVDSFKAAMYENVAKGYAKVVGKKNGEPIFSMTEAGERYVREELLDEPVSGGDREDR